MHTILILLTLLGLYALATAQDTTMPSPEPLERLTANYETAVERAISPLRKTYISELEKLKEKYTKSGELQNALAVDSALKRSTNEARSIKALTTKSGRVRYAYQLVPQSCRYEEAVLRAAQAGGVVAVPHSEKDIDIIADIAREGGVKQIHLGATRPPLRDGEWTCSDGTKLEPEIVIKIRLADEGKRTHLRLGNAGDRKSLDAHDGIPPLPFIIATPK